MMLPRMMICSAQAWLPYRRQTFDRLMGAIGLGSRQGSSSKSRYLLDLSSGVTPAAHTLKAASHSYSANLKDAERLLPPYEPSHTWILERALLCELWGPAGMQCHSETSIHSNLVVGPYTA